jgi:Cof subfamily protein (haloacid dehalogenase superfamily)
MGNYQLVAFDLDGTLLKNDQTLSPENAEAIAEMTRRGVHFAISTGRTYGEVLPILQEDPNIRFVIHSDGAVIYDKQQNVRHTCCFSGDLQKFVLDTLFARQTWFTIRYNGVSYYDGDRAADVDYDFCRITPYYRQLVRSCNVPKQDFQAFCYGMEEIEQITVFFHSDEELEFSEKAFRDTGLLDTSCSSPNSFEVYHKEAGKGNALWKLADMLGVGRDQTIAVGDTTNDTSIVKAAALGLATGNAMEALKEIADGVICTNEEHAARYVLEHYL